MGNKMSKKKEEIAAKHQAKQQQPQQPHIEPKVKGKRVGNFETFLFHF
jgi:hypothetical protein